MDLQKIYGWISLNTIGENSIFKMVFELRFEVDFKAFKLRKTGRKKDYLSSVLINLALLMPMCDILFLAVGEAVKHMQQSGMPCSHAWLSIYSYCTTLFFPGTSFEGLTWIFLSELHHLRAVLIINTQAAASSRQPPSHGDPQKLNID